MPRLLYLGRNERGFTMVELIIVMVIAGVLVGAGYAGFSGVMARYRCQGAINRVAQVLKLAQMKAVEQGANYFITLNTTNDTLTINMDPDGDPTTLTVALFEQINFAQEYPGINLVSGNNFRFNSRGIPKNPSPTDNGPGNTTFRLSPRNRPTEQGNVTIDVLGRIRVATPEKWKY
jgi:prepilin-type N-terminal cleavage/methylation domain-containing protein